MHQEDCWSTCYGWLTCFGPTFGPNWCVDCRQNTMLWVPFWTSNNPLGKMLATCSTLSNNAKLLGNPSPILVPLLLLQIQAIRSTASWHQAQISPVNLPDSPKHIWSLMWGWASACTSPIPVIWYPYWAAPPCPFPTHSPWPTYQAHGLNLMAPQLLFQRAEHTTQSGTSITTLAPQVPSLMQYNRCLFMHDLLGSAPSVPKEHPLVCQRYACLWSSYFTLQICKSYWVFGRRLGSMPEF